VLQVSRWDRLKDMGGVMAGFARADLPSDVHLMLAGPSAAGVTDDPEGAEVLAETLAEWRRLPAHARGRVSLASIPMEDPDENAAIVNALQRQATVITQKSLAEGFGLTVAEAMWKGKPVVASGVGGIQDQITHEQEGLLVDDPADLDAFAGALGRMVSDPSLAGLLGQAAHRRVLDNFLDDRHLAQSADLFETLLAGSELAGGLRPGRPNRCMCTGCETPLPGRAAGQTFGKPDGPVTSQEQAARASRWSLAISQMRADDGPVGLLRRFTCASLRVRRIRSLG
jgi:trehalose synthase